MIRSRVDSIADAVLYEGYILYPYRPSMKNRQRWTFGGLYPETYCRAQKGSDAAGNQTECVIRGTPETAFEAVVRFLHLSFRQVGQIEPPLAAWPDGSEPLFQPVESLQVAGKQYSTWQEAEEREVVVPEVNIDELMNDPRVLPFSFPGKRAAEPLYGDERTVVGLLVRERQAIAGDIELTALQVGQGVYRLTIRVNNRTTLDESGNESRDEALLRALVSTHEMIGVRKGAFVSLFDPPDEDRENATNCRNVGTWPVLIGEAGETDLMLSSPIILYDYPRVAPESQSQFFDGTEIDEMLTLRVMTMTADEKTAMAAVDEKTSALLAKVDGMTLDDMLSLHGTVRALRTVTGENSHG